MKKVERYQAIDDSIFEKAEEAIAHDEYQAKIFDVSNMLPPLPKEDDCNFANGHGFIQHDKEVFNKYKSAILELGGLRVHSEMTEWAKTPDEVPNMGITGRYFDDGDPELYRLWGRVMCTDSDYREWGQPYFALNPGKGELKKIA